MESTIQKEILDTCLWLLRKTTDLNLGKMIITTFINGYEDLTRYFVDQVRVRNGGFKFTDQEWDAYREVYKSRWESYGKFPSLENPFL